jgi:hypothetical protein
MFSLVKKEYRKNRNIENAFNFISKIYIKKIMNKLIYRNTEYIECNAK